MPVRVGHEKTKMRAQPRGKKYCGAGVICGGCSFNRCYLILLSLFRRRSFSFLFSPNENVRLRKQPTFCDATTFPREMTFCEETNGGVVKCRLFSKANIAFSFAKPKEFLRVIIPLQVSR